MTPRRVAIPLLPRVKAELERMVQLGVISPVEEPTEWCAGMVVAQKARLHNLGLQSLEYRRIFSDLVLCYKIVYQTVDLKRDDFFHIPLLSTTRGHSCKIQHKCIPHRSCRYHFFSNRVIHMWNSLPQHIVTAKDVKVFKSLLSKHDLSNLC